MKKSNFNIIILLGIILSVVTIGCQADDAEHSVKSKSDKELFYSKELSGEEFSNLSENYEMNKIFLEGKFKILQPNEDQLAFYTETENRKHIFLFNGIDIDIDEEMEIEKLYYLKNGVLLNKDMFLGVEGNINNLIIKDLNRLSNNKLSIENNTSKMLIYNWFSKNDENYEHKTAERLVYELVDLLDGPGSKKKCDSGGVGSTGCSQGGGSTGCSVSCGSGYYACCRMSFGGNKCDCVKQ